MVAYSVALFMPHSGRKKKIKITIKGHVEVPNSSMKYTFTVIYDLELVPRGRERDAARTALGLLTKLCWSPAMRRREMKAVV